MHFMKLVLEDGTELRGRSFGAPREVAGEVVFTTGMSGYVETLTDPSFRGQILVTTYPLQGNYGVPARRPAGSIDAPFESGRVQVQGMVCLRHSERPSHHGMASTLGEWLREENVPAVEGIDTRTLTRKLREHGTMKGWLLRDDTPTAEGKLRADAIDMPTVVAQCTVPEAVTYAGGELRVLLVDTGCKDNIARAMVKRGATVIRVPSHADLAKYLPEVDGVLLSNGPGDPEPCDYAIESTRELIEAGYPTFGICLGHQIMALASGAKTFKMKFGHHGANHPVKDLDNGRVSITSQNHGFAVDEATLPANLRPTHVSLFDGTLQGLARTDKPAFCFQGHPEASPGPHDIGYLFDRFTGLMDQAAAEKK